MIINPTNLLSRILELREKDSDLNTFSLWMSTSPFIKNFIIELIKIFDEEGIQYEPIKHARKEVMFKGIKLKFYNRSHEPRFQAQSQYSFIDETIYPVVTMDVIKMRSINFSEVQFSI